MRRSGVSRILPSSRSSWWYASAAAADARGLEPLLVLVLPLRPVVVALLFMDEPGDLLLLGRPDELMEPSDLGAATMAGAAVVAAVEKQRDRS